MDKISVVLIGIGGYATNYVTALFSDELKDKVNVVGAVDPYAKNSPKFLQIKEHNVPVFSDVNEFYSTLSAQLAIISTPISLHTKQIICCMQNGSDVLCEKPLCANADDIKIIQQAKNKYNKNLIVGFQLSTSNAILNAKKDILSGKYGKLLKAKSIVLWPRGSDYYNRSTKWAGKKYDTDGQAIFDSVANNAAAHYLHNMFFLLGDSACESKEPYEINAFLARANDIENFDTAVITFKIADGEGCFIASHATEKNTEPAYCFEFEKGKIFICTTDFDLQNQSGVENGHLVGVINDTVTDYGLPDRAWDMRKLEVAINVANGKNEDYCTLSSAAVHTRVINYIQNNFKIHTFKNTVLEDSRVYVKGLYECLNDMYINNDLSVLDSFIKENDNG